MNTTTNDHSTPASAPTLAIYTPRPTRLINFDTIMDATDVVEVSIGTGYVNPSYWRVGGKTAQLLEAQMRWVRWSFEWYRYEERAAKNADDTAAAPWPPFKKAEWTPDQPPDSKAAIAPADTAAADTTRTAAEEGHPTSEVTSQQEASAPSKANDAGNEPSLAQESMLATAQQGPASSSTGSIPETPPGLAVDEATRLHRIKHLRWWYEFLRDGPKDYFSPQDPEDLDEEECGVVVSVLRYLELG